MVYAVPQMCNHKKDYVQMGNLLYLVYRIVFLAKCPVFIWLPVQMGTPVLIMSAVWLGLLHKAQQLLWYQKVMGGFTGLMEERQKDMLDPTPEEYGQDI